MLRDVNQIQDGAVTRKCLRDDEINTNDTGRHDDTILITESEDTLLDTEFAALRDTLPSNTVWEGTTQDFRYNETDSAYPQDAGVTDLHKKKVILSNTIRYILYLTQEKEQLRQENEDLEASLNGLRQLAGTSKDPHIAG